ncbi:GNAT family N-acetyltransferase, partial [bacterium]
GTMFHLQQFLDYHQPGKFTFNHLMFMEKGKIAAVLPGQFNEGIYESPIGASYGSIVTGDISFAENMTLISCLLSYAKQNDYKEIVLTSAPIIYEKYPNQNLDFAMLWQGFKYSLHYISSAIKLDSNRDIISRFQSTVRRNIRKTLKNPDIRVEMNERYDQFYPILMDNKTRHNVTPTHSMEDLERLKTLLPDNLKLFMVYLKDKPIGGSLMFYANSCVAVCFYNMLLYDYAQYKPIHRVMYEVVKDATENGYRYVDIGVSQETKAEDPMTPRTSLIDFKEKFDAKTIMRNTLSIEL